MARADQGTVISGARLTAALSVSLAVHALALAALEGLPQGWNSEAFAQLPSIASPLRATLRAEAAVSESLPLVKAAPRKPIPERLASGPVRTAATKPATDFGVVQPVYYAPHELDERPLILVNVEPRFPSNAAPETGRVVLRLYVGELGTVERIAVVNGDPAGPFETAATEAFHAARFRPGMRAGVAVKSLVTLELLFGEPVPADPNESRAADSAPLANPNAAEAPDRAAVKPRRPRYGGGA